MCGRTFSKTLSSFIVACAIGSVAAPVAAGAEGEPIRLDRSGRTITPAAQYDPRIAVGAAAPVAFFTDTRDGIAQLRAARRENEWTNRVLEPSVHRVPEVAADGLGNVWAFIGDGAVLRAVTTTGDGMWDEGPSLGAGPLNKHVAVAGSAGVVALATWTGIPCRVVAAAGTAATASSAADDQDSASNDAVDITMIDARTRAVSETQQPTFPGPALSVGISVGDEGTVWLAASILVGEKASIVAASRDRTTGTWSPPETVVPEIEPGPVSIAAVDSGEVVVAYKSAGVIRTSVRAQVTGTWSAPQTIADQASAVLLVADRGGDQTPPLLRRGHAVLFWTDTTGAVFASDYRSAAVSIIPGTWSAPIRVINHGFQFQAAAGDDGSVWLAFATDDPIDVMAMRRTGDVWSAPERVNDGETYSADKHLLSVRRSGDDFEAFFWDNQGRSEEGSIRRSHLRDGSQTDTNIPAWAQLDLAPDGSLIAAWYRESTQSHVIRVEDASNGVKTTTSIPEQASPLVAAVGPAQFLLAVHRPNHPLRYRIYSEGAWSDARSLRIPDNTWPALVGAGAGTAWIVTAAFAPTEPQPDGTQGPVPFRIEATRLAASGTERVVLATGETAYFFTPVGVGDGAGGLAVVWAQGNPDGQSVMFASPGNEPVKIGENANPQSIALDPDGDAVVLWHSEDEILGVYRAGGGSFHALAPVPAVYDIGGGYDTRWCVAMPMIYAPPEDPVLALTDGGTAHVAYRDGNSLIYRSLAGGRWSPPVELGETSGYRNYGLDTNAAGAVGVAWATGARPNVRILGAVMYRLVPGTSPETGSRTASRDASSRVAAGAEPTAALVTFAAARPATPRAAAIVSAALLASLMSIALGLRRFAAR
jgi:hypothetical protein